MFGVELCCKEGTLQPETLRTYFASGKESYKFRILVFSSETKNYLKHTLLVLNCPVKGSIPINYCKNNIYSTYIYKSVLGADMMVLKLYVVKLVYLIDFDFSVGE